MFDFSNPTNIPIDIPSRAKRTEHFESIILNSELFSPRAHTEKKPPQTRGKGCICPMRRLGNYPDQLISHDRRDF